RDAQRHVVRRRGKRLRVSRVVDDVEAGEAHPDVARGHVVPVVVVELRSAALIGTVIRVVVTVRAESAAWDKELVRASVVYGRGMVTVVVYRHVARGRVKGVSERHIRLLSRRAANRRARESA